MKKLLALLIGILTAAAILAVAPRNAKACDPAPSFNGAFAEDDTPDCIALDLPYGGVGPGATQSMSVWNDCDAPFELELVDCVACDTSAVAEPAGEDEEPIDDDEPLYRQRSPEATLVIEGGDWSELDEGSTYQSHYTWQFDDQDGDVKVDVSFTGDNSDACSGAWCSTAGESLPTDTLVLIALVFSLMLFRRIGTGERAAIEDRSAAE